MPLEIVEMTTDQPEVAHAAIEAVYSPERPIAYSGDTDAFTCTMRLCSATEFGVDRMRYTMNAQAAMPVQDMFIATTLMAGAFKELVIEGHEYRLRAGSVARYPIDGELRGQWQDIELATVRLSLPTVRRVASERFGMSPDQVRFDSPLPVSPAAAERWRRLTRFLDGETRYDDGLHATPLIEAQLAELIAATALSVFPNVTMRREAQNGEIAAGPVTLRRAAAFIEDNAGSPLTISEIATTARVSPRALQYGFARHYDTTPTAYLRRVRLEHAHRELRAADPTSSETVAAVAKRWGFAKPSRFAALYRDAYGRPPSQTLRS